MDLVLVASCAASGGCAFAATYVACAGKGPAGWGDHARRDPLGELLGSLRSLPPLRRMEERAEAQRARADCLRQMPAMLDVLTLGLSAGLSFDSSLELYCQRCDNGLARALGAAMLSWRLGTQGRESALSEVARRLGVTSLERFSGVVAQALAFGSPLAATLEQQAQAIRDEQRALVEEEIERVPVKMLIPLGTLIVPAMLLAILGPLLGASFELG